MRFSCTQASDTDNGWAWNFSVFTTVNEGSGAVVPSFTGAWPFAPFSWANASSMIECDHGSACTWCGRAFMPSSLPLYLRT